MHGQRLYSNTWSKLEYLSKLYTLCNLNKLNWLNSETEKDLYEKKYSYSNTVLYYK
jgi:hypothetical protein